jgi:hypothetical protein
MMVTSIEAVKAAAERLVREVELHVAEYGNPQVAPNIETDMFTVAQFALATIAALRQQDE